ncbi:MAG: acyl-CoA dehydrogenase family protein [Pseudomonadota bacterium]
MNFTLSEETEAICQKVAAFVDTHVIPLEADRSTWNEYENVTLAERDRVRKIARAEGLWAPQVSKARGGMGLSFVDQAAFYETTNRSIFGPCMFNCAAPDDGNMRVLEQIGTEAQKERFLQPIIDGKVNSSFAMTEPAPGGGSDPGMMRTTAEKKGDHWVVRGRKWYISGSHIAQHFILVARTDPDQGAKRKHLTAFLFDRDDPGWRIVRRIDNMGPDEHGGICELEFDSLEIPDENRLLEIGDGLKVTQIRLGPARLTHCMRWLGLAKRCMELAHDYAKDRTGFGIRLADRESYGMKMGDVARNIQIGRLLVMHAAWKLDQGERAKKEISIAKVHVANTLHQAADTALQINGARGQSKDTIIEWIYRYARVARLVDGTDEVHNMVLSGFYADEGNHFWRWGV